MMKEQQQPYKSTTKFVVTNILIAAFVAVVLFVSVVIWLRHYTLHGNEVTIPQVTGMTQEEAEIVLRGSGLYLVVVDSTYSDKAPLGTVVEQTPPALSHAKPDRPVYVVMNARTKQLIPLPELHDVSYRQAEATLRSLGLKVDKVEYEPSLYPDNVLDVRAGGLSLNEGTRLPEGSGVTLVVGRRQGNSMVTVPNLLGMSLAQARSTLLQMGLTIGAYQYDVEPTPETLESYIIYQQSPTEGATLQEGSTVNINLTTNLERAIISDTPQKSDENFF
ncbi:MAG: PASTA domain-containing protein [Paludibacteraceae bacterium]|nr:PASTA domain-containing protein [Paludibacteraceae bacterium]